MSDIGEKPLLDEYIGLLATIEIYPHIHRGTCNTELNIC